VCGCSFTLEASFAGANFGKRKGMQFTPQNYEEIGSVFCDSLLDYCDPDQTKVRSLSLSLSLSLSSSSLPASP
jgi:hypothetical protein